MAISIKDIVNVTVQVDQGIATVSDFNVEDAVSLAKDSAKSTSNSIKFANFATVLAASTADNTVTSHDVKIDVKYVINGTTKIINNKIVFLFIVPPFVSYIQIEIFIKKYCLFVFQIGYSNSDDYF